ncbi:unnamed protein product [Symbiodinium pilosum]|uniref:C3H1-type domain-containing protein n=1 Tax=Symbiodinium pilosum TaxID=2952 RepID=A0A812NX53_SYMPI|nr:unnamed protein product [Symbiodinium pilosum]
MAKGSRWPDGKSSGKGKGRPPDNYKTDLCKFFERGLCEKGKMCPFAHGKEELRPSSLSENKSDIIIANKQKDAEVMSWLKERREAEGDAGETFEQHWKVWCKVHGLKDLPKAARLKSIHAFRAQMEPHEQTTAQSGGAELPAVPAHPSPTCPQGHRLAKCLASDEYECDGCSIDIGHGSTFWDCRECDYSLCVDCASSRTVQPAAPSRDCKPLSSAQPATSEPAAEAALEPVMETPVTDSITDNINSAAAHVWACSVEEIRLKVKNAIEDGLKLGDLIGLSSQQSPLKCTELVRQCEGRCAAFIGHFLFPAALPIVVQTCLSEQNFAGVCRALQLEALLQLEPDGELTTRASIASSLFLALFRASRRSPDNACLLVAIEAMLDFVCLVGTSHFVAMGVMKADAPLGDSKSDADIDSADGADGEEVLWQSQDAASGQQAHADVPEESEEAARARRVQAQQERKSSLRWDYTGGYRPAEAKRPETNEEATLRLINARCKGLRLGSEKASAEEGAESEPSRSKREPPRGSTVSEDPKVPRFKKDLCKYFERGHCDKGAQCTFAHGWEELRDGGSKAASSNGSLVHHGPSWESGPPPADKVYRKKI